MTSGMPLDVVGLDLDGTGRGTMTVRFASLPDFKAGVARLAPGTVMYGGDGQARSLRLDGSAPEHPADFPCEVPLAVVVTAAPADSAQQRMLFGNNFLGASHWVELIRFDPPTVEGTEGLLHVQCDTSEDYHQLRRFVDEEHGSALRSVDGGIWYVHRIADDGDPAQSFPQNVMVRVEWLNAG